MTATSTKPVKSCAVFDYPVLQWKHRTCRGYNDPELIARHERTQHPEGSRARKKQRAEKAKLAHKVTRSDGVRKPAGVR